MQQLTKDTNAVPIPSHPNHEMWAEGGLDTALSKLERIRMSLVRAAELLHDRDTTEASHLFVHCVDGLERFLETILVTRCALKLDFNGIHVDGISLSQIEKQFSSILSSMLDYQEKQDFEGLADKVEDELLTNLCFWSKAIRILQLSRASNA